MSNRPRVLRPVVAGVLVVASVALAGCTPAWKQAYQRAERAELGGDEMGALHQYRLACNTAPDESDACARVAELEQHLVASALADAKVPCAKGDLGRCLEALREVRGAFAPESTEHARIEDELDRAAARHVEACRQGPLARLRDAMARVRCVSARADEVDTSRHQRRVDEARREVAAFLLAQARAAQARDAHATAAAYAGLAVCTSGSAEGRAFRDETRARFLDENIIPLALRLYGRGQEGLGHLCGRLAQRTPLRCVEEQAALSLTAALSLATSKHTATRHDKQVEYVAGVDRYRNPDYDALQRRIDRDRRALRDLELNARLARGDCQAAESALAQAGYCTDCGARMQVQRLCNRSNALDETYQGAVNDLNDAIRTLNQTPAVLEQERWAMHSYTEVVHRWELPFELTLVLDGRPPHVAADEHEQKQRLQDLVVLEDIERPGFAPARLEADPLEAVSFTELAVAAEARALQEVERSLLGHLRATSERVMKSCENERDEDARVTCVMRALWYAGGEPVDTLLRALSDGLETPYPPAPCVE